MIAIIQIVLMLIWVFVFGMFVGEAYKYIINRGYNEKRFWKLGFLAVIISGISCLISLFL